jgi:hypothetical protein
VSFSINQQEHAFDNVSIIENLEGQYEAVHSAKHLYPDKPIHVSPLTFRRCNNHYATDMLKRKLSNEENQIHNKWKHVVLCLSSEVLRHSHDHKTSRLPYFKQ